MELVRTLASLVNREEQKTIQNMQKWQKRRSVARVHSEKLPQKVQPFGGVQGSALILSFGAATFGLITGPGFGRSPV